MTPKFSLNEVVFLTNLLGFIQPVRIKEVIVAEKGVKYWVQPAQGSGFRVEEAKVYATCAEAYEYLVNFGPMV